MNYSRENIIKYMSEIFKDIPNIIIGDIFDYISRENIKLCKQNSDRSYEDEIISVCNSLFEKLSEISNADKDVDELNLDFDINDNLTEYFEKSYLNACMQNISSGDNLLNNNNFNNINKEIQLLKKSWNLFNIEELCIKNEINIFKLYLKKIFNSKKLYQIKESKNKKWPPDGPGEESLFIPIRIKDQINIINKNDNIKLKNLEEKIENINININELKMQYKTILNNSNLKEYKLIKIDEYNENIKKLNIEKKVLKDKHYNLLFNIQNLQFIEFIIDNKNDNMILIDLHHFNRFESINIIIFCITMILKYKLNINFKDIFFNSKKNDSFINEEDLLNSQKIFKGNFIDLYICVGLGNHNDNNNPKLASLVRRICYGLNLIWRFGLKGIIILRIQNNREWFKFINQILKN